MSSKAASGAPGLVFFVGAGPGAADLITVRGARALARAEVVLHDALTDPALRELAPGARWIDVGKRGFCDSTGQTRINALLVQQARRARVVVRLKGGDPSVFGRLEEELEALAEAGIASEVVPGVTAALGEDDNAAVEQFRGVHVVHDARAQSPGGEDRGHPGANEPRPDHADIDGRRFHQFLAGLSG